MRSGYTAIMQDLIDSSQDVLMPRSKKRIRTQEERLESIQEGTIKTFTNHLIKHPLFKDVYKVAQFFNYLYILGMPKLNYDEQDLMDTLHQLKEPQESGLSSNSFKKLFVWFSFRMKTKPETVKELNEYKDVLATSIKQLPEFLKSYPTLLKDMAFNEEDLSLIEKLSGLVVSEEDKNFIEKIATKEILQEIIMVFRGQEYITYLVKQNYFQKSDSYEQSSEEKQSQNDALNFFSMLETVKRSEAVSIKSTRKVFKSLDISVSEIQDQKNSIEIEQMVGRTKSPTPESVTQSSSVVMGDLPVSKPSQFNRSP